MRARAELAGAVAAAKFAVRSNTSHTKTGTDSKQEGSSRQERRVQTEEPREVCDCATYAGPEGQPRVYEYETEPDKKICQISPHNQYKILYYKYKLIRLELITSITVHGNGYCSPLLLRYYDSVGGDEAG